MWTSGDCLGRLRVYRVRASVGCAGQLSVSILNLDLQGSWLQFWACKKIPKRRDNLKSEAASPAHLCQVPYSEVKFKVIMAR